MKCPENEVFLVDKYGDVEVLYLIYSYLYAHTVLICLTVSHQYTHWHYLENGNFLVKFTHFLVALKYTSAKYYNFKALSSIQSYPHALL